MSKKGNLSDKKLSRRKIFRGVILILGIVLVFAAVLLVIRHFENKQGEVTLPVASDSVVMYNGVEYKKKNNTETLLVMGLDKYESASTDDESYTNDRQSDFLMLFVIDNDAKTCTAVHINRDTMADINVLGLAGETVNTVNKQIALAHTYGNGGRISCQNTVNSVSDLFGNLKVNHYISVTMDTVPEINDLVGGVQVTVLDDFSGIDDTLVKGEEVTLMGDHALTYVRTRYQLDDSSNKNRMERQRQYINALVDKTRECAANDDTFILNTLTTVSDNLVSDCTITQLDTLFDKLSTYEFMPVYTIDGEYVTGEKHMEFYADEDSIKKTVMELIYEPVA